MLVFVEGRATKSRRVWRVFFMNESIGTCSITNDGSIDDEYHTIYLKLRAKSRGFGLGWKSFAGVALLSQIDFIHAEAAKKNKSSIGALKKAGFIENTEKSAQFNSTFSNTMTNKISAEKFISLMPPSFWTDYADYFCNHDRHAIRTVLAEDLEKGNYIVEQLGLFLIVDFEGFAAISFNRKVCEDTLKIDQSIDESRFIGKYLGYPECCRLEIEKEKISNIDDYAAIFSKNIDDKSVLYITDYLEGKALISHVPCSEKCIESIGNADSVKAFLKKIGIDSCYELPKLLLEWLM